MDTEALPIWLVSSPASSKKPPQAEFKKLEGAASDSATVRPFAVPKELKVGTLDTLMSLSDDLVRIDTLAEGTTFKIFKQLAEMQKDAGGAVEEPKIELDGRLVSLEHYLLNFKWDDAKYSVKQPLRELVDSLVGAVTRMDDELKDKATKFQTAKGAKQAVERKETGNLLVKPLHDIVMSAEEKEVGLTDTENLATVLLVVPKANVANWESSYANLAQFHAKDGKVLPGAVPGSSKKRAEDAENILVSVLVFKRVVDDFKHKCRENRFIVRDAAMDPAALSSEKDAASKAKAEYDKSKSDFLRWCKTNLAEAYSAMVHLKTVRLFTESILRYGVGEAGSPSFQAALLKPKPRKDVALRKVLDELYSGLADSSLLGGGEEDMPGQGSEFYPYVYLTAYTAPPAF